MTPKCIHCGCKIYYSYGAKCWVHEGDRPSLIQSATIARLKNSAFGQSAYSKWVPCEDENGNKMKTVAEYLEYENN